EARWWLVDWDDLQLGDPAIDLAILLAPQLNRGEAVQHLLGERDRAFMKRFAVGARAVLLDEVIDPLADWSMADQAPSGVEALRREKWERHRSALRQFRERNRRT